MKTLKSLWILVPLFLLTAAVPSPQNITLAWDAQPDIEVFKLYTSINVSAPLNTWALLRTIPGTNTQVTISVAPGKAFYYLTASNFWGESDPSNVAGTPAAPRQGGLSIRNGP